MSTDNKGKWPARIALIVSVGMLAIVLGGLTAFGNPGLVPMAQATGSASASGGGTARPSGTAAGSASPSASASRCTVPVGPLCPSPRPSDSATPSGSGSPSSTASPSGSPGPGGQEEHRSRVTIRYTGLAFKGAVKSVGKCEPRREVVVRKIRRGPDAVIGRDTTNSRGGWKVAERNAKPGRYYAKVLKRVFTQSDVQITCKGARSDNERVS